MVLRPGGLLRDARPLLACLSLGFAVIGALVILFSVVSPAGAQATGCETTPDRTTGRAFTLPKPSILPG